MDEEMLQQLKEEKKADMADGEDAAEQQEQALRQQLKQIASQIMTEDARKRLSNIRTVNEELASQIELQLIQLHRAGQIRDRITDEQMKELLRKVRDDDDDRDIRYATR